MKSFNRESNHEPYWDVVKRIITESDLVLEILDSRLVELSRNEEVENLIKRAGRPVIFVVNKSDLVSSKTLNKQVNKLKSEVGGGDVVFVSAKKPKDVKVLLYAIKKAFGKHGKREKSIRVVGDPKPRFREARGEIVVGVLGYPNVGKSSIINALSHKKKVPVSKKSGTTHGIHWIRASEDIKLVDSPGVIPLAKSDEVRYGLIGAKDSERLKDPSLVAQAVIKLFMGEGFKKIYNISLINKSVEEVIEEIGRLKGFLVKGNKVDEHRVCSLIVKDWQEGRLRV